ncbi:MAG: MMPL family transporter [Magnetovibrionaceae bacterium]
MQRLGGLIWLLVVFGSVVTIAWHLQGGALLQTDIRSLLAEPPKSPWIEKAEDRLEQTITQRVLILVGHSSFDQASRAATILQDALVRSGTLAISDGAISDGATTDNSWHQALFTYRGALLSEVDRQALKAGETRSIVDNALAQLYSPFGMAEADLISKDPFFLFSRALLAPSRKGNRFHQSQGFTWVKGPDKTVHILLSFTLLGGAFEAAVQDRLVAAYSAAENLAKNDIADLQLLKVGAVFYAAEGLASGQREGSLFGTLSLIGVVLLTLLAFRGPRPLLFSLIAIGAGVLAGLAACLSLFGQLHLMALVFGAGLIGIASDYTFHYCCENLQTGDADRDGSTGKASTSRERCRAIAPGLTLGVISSCIGFLILATTPFPGLRQIAVFSGAGLVMAYISVIGLFPLIDKGGTSPDRKRLARWAALPDQIWHNPERSGWRWVLVLSLVGLCGLGGLSFQARDDVKALQSLPPDLSREEARMTALTGFDTSGQAYLIQGASESDALRREENVRETLKPLIRDGVLDAVQSLSQIIPSPDRQAENAGLIRRSLLGSSLGDLTSSLGMTISSEAYSLPKAPLTLDAIEGATLVETFRLSEGVHLMRLLGVTDSRPLQALADQSEDVFYLDRAAAISDLLQTYRHRAVWSLVLAVGVIGLFLATRYGPGKALMTLLPPLVALMATPLLLAVFGHAFSVIHALALVLVLAIGLDFVLFRRESYAGRIAAVDLANGLSAISTLLAFGLMSFSSMAALQSFGLTIAIGIALAYLFAPLSRPLGSEPSPPT